MLQILKNQQQQINQIIDIQQQILVILQEVNESLKHQKETEWSDLGLQTQWKRPFTIHHLFE